MFYEKQPKENRKLYKELLDAFGRMSRMYSENKSPYLEYRAHENFFCRCFGAENLSREDNSADAKKEGLGIGLKTWMGNDDQKVAEFGKLKKNYTNLEGLELVKKISEYRNERIRITKNLKGIENMIYHVVKRIPNKMQILECAFDSIDIENIRVIENRGNENNTYFTDEKHVYHFSISKNTLYMIFDSLELLDEFEVEILDNPYDTFLDAIKYTGKHQQPSGVFAENIKTRVDIRDDYEEEVERLCLPLYSLKKGNKFVAEKSGLNQWNAGGRARHANEIYIPYNKIDRNRNRDFFPPRDTPFNLHLPDGTEISAKVCQEADKNDPKQGKAIMSNPNKVLGKWLLRDVFELPEKTIITYEMLEKFGIDSVVFTKNDELDYSIEFSEIGTYEEFYEN